jgi:hypothetical protein
MKNFDDFKKACLGKRYRKTIQIPYSDDEFLIDLRILSSHETMEAEVAALNYIDEKKIGKDSDAFLIESHCQVLYRSCHECGSESKFFKTLKDTRSIPTEMILYLWGQYSALNEEVSVISNDLTEYQLEDIKKKLSNGEAPLGLSYLQLVQALMVLGGFKPKQDQESKSHSDANSMSSPINKSQSMESSSSQLQKKQEKHQTDLEENQSKNQKTVVEVEM